MCQATLQLFTPQIRYALIEGYDGFYRISDYGAIESYKRGEEWRVRVLCPDRHGYLHATLSHHGKQSLVYVHKLVCYYFVGIPGPDEEVAHNNGIRTDNHYTNIRVSDHSGNMQDRLLHGTDHRGERSPMARLTWDQVHEIRAIGSRVPVRVLARQYPVGEANLRKILRHETWLES